ncbi:hypothetical protein BDV35DRAFT_383585 [Aspergillus flavus]|uniref:Myb-like domain-containing protein n=1 Tax=Aspergillus flavus TaxID=5059 RepID=A0A5N6GM63_ASPFL|nr:hypothetical protein BDV35DRAFT_383585 [Aspergillus flavus]
MGSAVQHRPSSCLLDLCKVAPYQSNAPSGTECPASLETPRVDRTEYYSSIAVVVPVPPWARGKVSVPDATRQRPKEKPKTRVNPILAQTPKVDTSGKQMPYTSEENALLVRLKERERTSWAEIAAHFPEQSASSLQVHYSTKLRHKATTQAGRLRSRR